MAPELQGHHQPVAIVGMSCRFAGEASSPSALWKLCEKGKTAWSPIPPERFDTRSFYHPDKGKLGRSHVAGGYFLDQDISSFDAGFFNLSADVAAAMDPQLRLLLESVYEAMEDGGIPLEKMAGTNTSVFTGCWSKDYQELQARDPDTLPASFLTGNGTAMLSNRISHFFDLQGPSMSIDTGCSSGLVAIHQGCRSILWGESDVSIVSASNLLLSPDLFIALSNLRMTGADGKCYPWDSRAQGYGRGEGVAALILKPLHAALRDGDHVHALIRSTGLNQDGKTRSITSPSVAAQVRLIEQCYKSAGLKLSETGYVEAHMTGTLVGDLAESEALAMTFGKSRGPDDPVLVGSVKTNIGHTEPVSGLAAIIKTVEALKRRQIPPNLNYEKTNPRIQLQEWNLKVPTSLTQWPENKPLRASINNFGYGGTNAHIILEAAPDVEAQMDTRHFNIDPHPKDRIFVVTAKSSVALKTMMAKLRSHVLASVEDNMLGDLAYTLSERRSRMSVAAAVRASSRNQLAERLEQWPRKLSPTPNNRPLRLGFVFNGQGAQWHAMGRELIDAYPVFGSGIQRADRILRDMGSTWSLRDEVLRDAETTRVSEVNLSQPLTAVLQLCLVDLLGSWGITPVAVTGHSSGEIAAAYAAGRLTFGEALAVAYWRGELAFRNEKLMSSPGGMMAIRLGPEDVAKYIADTPGGHVVVACINSPTSLTLSGDMVALDEVKARLEGRGMSPRKLDVPLAYHSHHMLSMEQEYTEKLESILSTHPSSQGISAIRFSSPVSGDIVQSSEVLTAKHWSRNLTSPVLFSQALEKMCFSENGSTEVDMVVEVGAHGTLAGPIRQLLKGHDIMYAFCLQRSVDAVETMQNLACELVNRGYPVSLPAINSPFDEKHTFLAELPTYAWDHALQYWKEPRISKEMRHKKFVPHELLGSLLPGDNGLSPTWRNFIRLDDIPWLIDHQVDSRVVLPTAAYIVMAVEAVRLVTAGPLADTPRQFELRDVQILNVVKIPESSTGIEIQFNLHPMEQGWYQFTLSSLDAAGVDWLVNCTGACACVAEEQAIDGVQQRAVQPHFLDGTETERRSTIVPDSLFSRIADMGTYYGPAFRNLTDILVARNKSVTDFQIPETISKAQEYLLHPTTLESILQATYNVVPQEVQKTSTVVTQSIDKMLIHSGFSTHSGDIWQAHTETRSSNDTQELFTSQVTVLSRRGDQLSSPVFEMNKFVARAVPRSEETGQESEEEAEPFTSRLEWELDVWHDIPQSVKDSMRITLTEEQVAFEKKMMRLSYYLIHDAVGELEGTSSSETRREWQTHHRMLFDWMKETVALGENGQLSSRSKAWSRAGKGAKQLLVDEMMASGDASACLTIRVGKALASIVRGEVTPLELMMQGNLLHQYYIEYPKLKDRTYKHLGKVAQLLAISRPGANILEIGAGTGGATKVILEAFSPVCGTGTNTRDPDPLSLVGHYTFTDVSSGFFSSARDRFAPWTHLMDFRRLNVEGDLGHQAFAEGSYDIIVASLVLHATESLHRTMSNVRKLLKPGGKLLLIETTTDRLDLHLIFGTLPGWWLGTEPDRNKSPNVPLATWDRVLRGAGLTGIEFEIGDCEEAEFQCASLIVTSAATTITTASYPSAISIVQAGTSVPVSAHGRASTWVRELCQAIHQRIGVMPDIEEFDAKTDRTDWHDKVCIFVAEMSGPFVHGMDQTTFEKLRDLLVTSRGLIWLSCGGAMDAEQPLFAETQGLLRTLRQEDAGKRCVQLDFRPSERDDGDNWTSDKISHIVDVFERNFASGQDQNDNDWEYSVKDSMLYVPRLYPQRDVEGHAAAISHRPLEDSDATYLVVGGVRGMGRAILAWMVDKGAKHVLIVSRTTAAHGDDDDIIRLRAEAEVRECNVQFRCCDVSDKQKFSKLLADCATSLPRIRGVINAAMVVDDTVLERMTWDQWCRATQAKVATSMNLHTCLPDLRFFVLLSSITGVTGYSSEANYAAGNAFQDALARHRTVRGQPAVALDLSVVVGSVGWVARHDEADDVRKRIEGGLGAASVSMDRVLALLETAILGDRPQRRPADSQVVVGLWRYEAIPDDASVTKRDRRFGTLRLGLRSPRGGGEGKVAAEATAATCARDSMARLVAAARAAAEGRAAALDAAERADWRQLLVDAVSNKLASIFNSVALAGDTDLDLELPLAQLGVDSLVAVDLRNWLAQQLKASISVSDITQASSLSEFIVLIAETSELLKGLV